MTVGQQMRFVTPAGRLIAGDLTTVVKTQMNGQPEPNEKRWYRFIQLAIPKTDPGVNALIGQIYNHALASVQQNQMIAARVQQGFAGPFKWKIKDGDTPNAQGQPRPEHAHGCWLFNFQTTLPISACNNRNEPIDPASVKRGYWVDIGGNVSFNGLNDHNAGFFMNPTTVRLLGFMPEIVGGPSPDQVFANAPAPTALPAGVSATPIASGPMPQGGYQQPQPGMMPGAGGMPQGGYQQPQPGMMPGAGGMPQGGYQQPQPGMMPGAGGMPQGGYQQPQPGMMPGAGGMPQGGYQQPQPGMMPGAGGYPQASPQGQQFVAGPQGMPGVR